MSRGRQALSCALVGIGLVLASGCATPKPQPPLNYVALTRPTGAIKATGKRVDAPYSKCGWYFLNYGFRPASDVGAYIEKAQTDSGATVLKNADVKFGVPFAIDILMFGYQAGADTVTANQ